MVYFLEYLILWIFHISNDSRLMDNIESRQKKETHNDSFSDVRIKTSGQRRNLIICTLINMRVDTFRHQFSATHKNALNPWKSSVSPGV